MPSKTRYFVFVAVAGAHALVLGVLLDKSRAVRLFSAGDTSLAAFFVTKPARTRSPAARPSLNESSVPIAPVVEPIALALPTSPVMSASGQPIDWGAAAGRAAGRVLERKARRRISFGFPSGGKSAITMGVYSPATPAHYAGESDRMPGGEITEWVSDRCYVVSDPPSPGEPDFLKNARLTHSGCLPPPGPDPGELFQSLSAYKRLHPHE